MNTLSATDVKMLYYIQTHGRINIMDLHDKLGYPIDLVNKSVSKLGLCKLVNAYSKDNIARPVSLQSYCRIKSIIAIEAKVDKWSEAIRQAGNNVWFSTESYILMDKESCSDSVFDYCRQMGVGIILANRRAKTILESKHRNFPVSYASLQFNEWILRFLNN